MPFSDNRQGAIEHALQITTQDGFRLSATLFAPPVGAMPDAALVINSATGVPRRFYGRFATFLANRGFAVLTYDYRGIGDSRPRKLRTFKSRLRDWAHLDMPAALDWAARSLAPAPLFLLGHSAGGNLVGLVPNLGMVQAVVLVASQLGYWKHWPSHVRYGIAATWYALVPAVSRTVGYVPGWMGVGQDWPGGVALELARWCRHPEYLFGDRSLDVSGYAHFESPLLAYTFADDPHATRSACEHLLARFSRAQITHHHIEPWQFGLKKIGHFGFFRQPCVELWSDCARWLLAREGAGRERTASPLGEAGSLPVHEAKLANAVE